MNRWYVGLAIAVAWSALFFFALGALGIGQNFYDVDLAFILFVPSYIVLSIFSGCSNAPNKIFSPLITFMFFGSGLILHSSMEGGLKNVVTDVESLGKVSILLFINFCLLIAMERQGNAYRKMRKSLPEKAM